MRARTQLRAAGLALALTLALPAGAGAAEKVVWAVGDGADGGEHAKAVSRLIASQPPHRLLYLGDVYENGTAEDYANSWRPVYGAFDPIVRPTPGNHEWDNRGQGYYPYWRGVRGKPFPAYYSFRAGGWQILSLNSETRMDEGARQNRWLRKRLDAYRGSCRIAFWHRPLLSAGRTTGSSDVEPLWAALSGRTRLVLNGHEHNMQHHAQTRGITQLISGAGGRRRYSVKTDPPGLVFGNDDKYGALRLNLSPGLARFAFVATDGRILHSGQVRCRRLVRMRR